jgi:hypothetical protein
MERDDLRQIEVLKDSRMQDTEGTNRMGFAIEPKLNASRMAGEERRVWKQWSADMPHTRYIP